MTEDEKNISGKKIDGSWKEAVEKEKHRSPDPEEKPLEATFGLFLSGLMMECLVALGDAENPITRKKEFNILHAKYIIDTLAMLKEKTHNNLSSEESQALEGILYELRMRFLAKTSKEK